METASKSIINSRSLIENGEHFLRHRVVTLDVPTDPLIIIAQRRPLENLDSVRSARFSSRVAREIYWNQNALLRLHQKRISRAYGGQQVGGLDARYSETPYILPTSRKSRSSISAFVAVIITSNTRCAVGITISVRSATGTIDTDVPLGRPHRSPM